MRSPAGPTIAGHVGSPAVQPPAGTLTAPTRLPRSSERPTSQQATHEACAAIPWAPPPYQPDPYQSRATTAEAATVAGNLHGAHQLGRTHCPAPPLDGDPSDHPGVNATRRPDINGPHTQLVTPALASCNYSSTAGAPHCAEPIFRNWRPATTGDRISSNTRTAAWRPSARPASGGPDLESCPVGLVRIWSASSVVMTGRCAVQPVIKVGLWGQACILELACWMARAKIGRDCSTMSSVAVREMRK